MGKMASAKDLDFFIENELNVLFRGLHGVGKTSMIFEAFERHKLEYRYFSAPTMDPWVDFVGVPKEVYDDETGEMLLKLIRPTNMVKGKIVVLVFDELNRAKAKVRNAVMELIQFRSINGEPFPNLKMIWAAINPEETEDADISYDVERLDPAQADRFDVVVDVPYEPIKSYFEKMHGEAGLGAVEWWHELEDAKKLKVTPRRLDKALDIFKRGGDIRFVIPDDDINVGSLKSRIDTGSLEEKLEELMTADEEERVRFFNNINNLEDCVYMILAKPEYIREFTPYVLKDRLSDRIVEEDGKYLDTIIENAPADCIAPVLGSLLASESVRRPMRARIKDAANARQLDLTSENAFREAVDQALAKVGETQSDRHNGLHGILGNFNSKAGLDTFEQCMEFMVKMINHTKDESLRDSRKPYHQISIDVLPRMDNSLQKLYKTSVMEVFEELAKDRLSSMKEDRLEHAREILELYLADGRAANSE